jgi:hypothetical protein
MKSNKSKTESFMLPGQLTLWDIEITEKSKIVTENPISYTETVDKVAEIKVLYTELLPIGISAETEKSINPLELTDRQQDFLNKNNIYENKNLNRVIKYCGGGLGIELQYGDSFKIVYVNTQGREEFSSNKKIPVLPMDKILYYKSALSEFNNTQEEKLKEILQKTTGAKVIRRKADDNILIEIQDKVVSINPIGLVLEFYGCKTAYEEDEVERQDPVEEVNIKDLQKSIKLGDIIEAQHGARVISGEIVRVYGPGDVTLNIVFDNGAKHTAIHRSRVTKLIKCA